MPGLRVLAREGSGRSRPRGGGEGAGRRRLLTRPRRDPAFVGATSAASSSEWPATTHLGQKLAAEALPQGRSCLPGLCRSQPLRCPGDKLRSRFEERRSEEHTSELQSLMRISYAVFCLQKKNQNT